MESEKSLLFPEMWSEVLRKVNDAKARRVVQQTSEEITVIAVSKTKPKEAIIEAYSCGCKHFGENYVNELVEKATDPEVQEMCPEIKWYFIGHLQSNKVNKLVALPNLHMIQTIDSVKLACLVDKAWEKLSKGYRLEIMIQVNTSEEKSKSGISPAEASSIVKEIKEKCKNLEIVGLMTIGHANYDLNQGPNPEFQLLAKLKESLIKDLNFKFLHLSMGMSHDFQHAVEQGSTYVRVGSALFGARDKKSPK